jgi:hypothetical protein
MMRTSIATFIRVIRPSPHSIRTCATLNVVCFVCCVRLQALPGS